MSAKIIPFPQKRDDGVKSKPAATRPASRPINDPMIDFYRRGDYEL